MAPGPDLPVITDLMESAITFAATRPERTRADIWSVLLRLAGTPPASPGPGAGHDHVAAALSYVEFRLPEPLSSADRRAIGLSPGHLTRFFVAATGEDSGGYCPRRRIDHARRLPDQQHDPPSQRRNRRQRRDPGPAGVFQQTSGR